jgi:ATP-dependent helicase/nuclease subunit A
MDGAVKRGHSPLDALRGDQARASDPGEDVWLSASAGTGKTHVLASRVYRLLLNKDVRPESILCLTFTKAGAAEMAERIHRRLADWVRLPTPALKKDLFALGEAHDDDEVINRARTLFASVLDARGGGLRIQTIHRFCQSLLAAFPAEIGLTPGFRAMEAREEAALANQVLSDMVVKAQAEGRLGVTDALRALVLRLSEDRTRDYLIACARAPDAMAALGIGVEAKVRTALGLPLSDVMPFVISGCSDDGFPQDELRELVELNAQWGTTRAQQRVVKITNWLALPADQRVRALGSLASAWTKADGTINLTKGWVPTEPGYAALSETLFTHFNGLVEVLKLSELAVAIASALSLGQEYARAYSDAKRAAGLVDFDDLIRKTVALLALPGIGEWIRFKLDQSTDHILVDEAQDTNARQWAIIEALADEFYAGEGAKGAKRRTIFTVGDYKQAIFSFQGTNPQEFSNARGRFAERAAGVGRELLMLSLSQSFRSSKPVLAVVDSLIEEIGHDRLGLARPDPAHSSARGDYGAVTLWPPVADIMDSDGGGEDEEEWIGENERAFAKKLAREVKGWLDAPLYLTSQKAAVQPQDIMILVRSRGDLARLIVARLHEAGVPVAGLDRLRLSAPLAVRDLLSCIRFVLQPDDDLNLAALLVSPIIGWDQDGLYAAAFGRSGTLWRAIREHAPSALSAMLTMADVVTPYRFLEAILSGEIDARRKLIARMGHEIRDSVDELLSAALAFEQNATPTLQQFIDWFDRGDVDVKRDPSAPEAAVRVMTVHGAKGLQAPIVVLADATRDPDNKRATQIDWTIEDGLTLPIFKPRSAESIEVINAAAAADDQREREEHWRLLYVAMTRAEERLYIGGAYSRRQASKGELSPDCWHSACARALSALGAATEADGALVHANLPRSVAMVPRPAAEAKPLALPEWARAQAPQESRPPRPLAPSSLGKDDIAIPPPSAALRSAAERGRLMHSLFERLPDVVAGNRVAAGLRWLERSAGVADPLLRAALIADALRVIDDANFADIFAPGALVEAPIAGVVNGIVISGTVDRLIIRDRQIIVIDFKTGSRIPRNAEAVPRTHLRQMSAYASVLAGIFPQHEIAANLLYTAGPTLLSLSVDLIEAHKPPYAD